MSSSRAFAIACMIDATVLAACQPKAVPANPPPPPQAAAPPPPVKMATMVCRNSQTGASVECGTPNAVMVGVKDK